MKKRKPIVVVLVCIATFCHASAPSDTTIIRTHLKALTKTKGFRTYDNINQLNLVAEYIQAVFSRYTDKITAQKFSVEGKAYKNIIASFGTENVQRIVIGAHYDVCG